jgi:hypothetical protein
MLSLMFVLSCLEPIDLVLQLRYYKYLLQGVRLIAWLFDVVVIGSWLRICWRSPSSYPAS